MSESVEAYKQAAAMAAQTGQKASVIENLISLAVTSCYNDLPAGLQV